MKRDKSTLELATDAGFWLDDELAGRKPSPLSLAEETDLPTCRQCGHTWPRDPSLEVPCPECGSAIGKRCTALRPSGHRHSAAYAGLPAWGHDARDLAAAAADKYGCGCGITPAEAAQRLAAL